MIRFRIPLLFALCTVSLLHQAPAQTAATQPTTRPVDTATPMALMISYDQLAGQDPPAYRALYFVTDDPDIQRLAHVQAKFDAQVGMLQKIVQDKWGDDAVDQVLHTLGLKSRRDIDAATVKLMAHHATVIFADGTPGPQLFKTKAGWRVDLPAFRDSLGTPLDDYCKQLYQISNFLPDVADEIVSEKLKGPSAVVSEIVKRLNTPAR